MILGIIGICPADPYWWIWNSLEKFIFPVNWCSNTRHTRYCSKPGICRQRRVITHRYSFPSVSHKLVSGVLVTSRWISSRIAGRWVYNISADWTWSQRSWLISDGLTMEEFLFPSGNYRTPVKFGLLWSCFPSACCWWSWHDQLTGRFFCLFVACLYYLLVCVYDLSCM